MKENDSWLLVFGQGRSGFGAPASGEGVQRVILAQAVCVCGVSGRAQADIFYIDNIPCFMQFDGPNSVGL